MLNLHFTLRDLDQFARKAAGFDVRLRATLMTAMRRAAATVEARAKALVSGPVLRVRTGYLRRSITHRVDPLDHGARGVISAGARYARIHELGGRIHVPEIMPRRAKALHFYVGGGGRGLFHGYGVVEVFAKRTRAHDVQMPARPFMSRALEETRPQIEAEIRQAVREAAAGRSLG